MSHLCNCLQMFCVRGAMGEEQARGTRNSWLPGGSFHMGLQTGAQKFVPSLHGCASHRVAGHSLNSISALHSADWPNPPIGCEKSQCHPMPLQRGGYRLLTRPRPDNVKLLCTLLILLNCSSPSFSSSCFFSRFLLLMNSWISNIMS